MLVKIRHHQVRIGVRLDVDGDAQAVLFVHLVGQIGRLRQLAVRDDGADLVLECSLVDAVGNGGDDDLPFLAFFFERPFGLHLDAALAVLVDFAEVAAIGDDLAAERKVGALDLVEQVGSGGVAVFDQKNAGPANIAEIVRRNVGRHADRDAGDAVDEQIRELRGQDDRLLQRAVVIGPRRHGLLPKLGEEMIGNGSELGFGVALMGGRIAVHRAEVALPGDERQAHHPVLGHADQRVVDGGVAVRMILTHHVADDAGAFRGLAIGIKLQVVIHRVEDAPLHRLEAVAHVRQGA